jgi:hypothetical protein
VQRVVWRDVKGWSAGLLVQEVGFSRTYVMRARESEQAQSCRRCTSASCAYGLYERVVRMLPARADAGLYTRASDGGGVMHDARDRLNAARS